MTLVRTFDLTFRIAVLIAALLLGALCSFASAKQAFAANLRGNGAVSENMLRLGDIFDGLTEDQEIYVLGPAPQPGQDMILNARTLLRISLAMNLNWRPQSAADQIVISRAATVIGKDVIEEALVMGLKEKGVEGAFNLKFAGLAPEMTLPGMQEVRVDIGTLDVDARRGTFQATMVAPSKEDPVSKISVSGQIQRTVSVPVLANPLKSGDIIGANDIIWVDLEDRALQSDIVMNEKELIGRTPRRVAMAGKPLRAVDFEYPQIVNRGDSVNIVFESGPMVLSAQGRALQSGAYGDTVRVVNNDSNRSLDAVVSASGEVKVK